MSCAEYREWVAADVDGVLGAEEARVRAHLEGCPDCRALRATQLHVRTTLRSRALGEEAPFGLRTRILANLDDVAAESDSVSGFGRLSRWTAVTAAAVTALLLLRPGGGDSLDRVVDHYYAAVRGEMPLAIRTASAEEVERYYERHPSKVLPGHVVDLEDAGFRLVGAAVREVDGQPHRFTVYSDGKNLVLCDYLRAADYAGEVPPNGRPVFFSRGGLTFCVRRMGGEICILATRLPMHAVVPRLLGWT